MGERLTLNIYKGLSKQGFRSVVEAVLGSHGGSVQWDAALTRNGTNLRTSHNDDVHVIYLPYSGGLEYLLCHAIAKHTQCPWIELRVQEGSLWEMVVYRGDRVADLFSVNPRYWDDDATHISKWQGHPDIVAEVWGIDVRRIQRYMVDWEPVEIDDDTFDYTRSGKANPDDTHGYGDIWQMYDVLRALGGNDPVDVSRTGAQHSIKLPPKRAYRTSDM